MADKIIFENAYSRIIRHEDGSETHESYNDAGKFTGSHTYGSNYNPDKDIHGEGADWSYGE